MEGGVQNTRWTRYKGGDKSKMDSFFALFLGLKFRPFVIEPRCILFFFLAFVLSLSQFPSRTGQAEQDRQKRTYRKGHLEWDRQNSTGRTAQANGDIQNETGRTRQEKRNPEGDRQKRTGRTGLAEQDR